MSALSQSAPRSPGSRLDVEEIRRDFPILSTRAGEHPLVYLDNAASSQKPEAVISRVADFYRRENANIHRGIYRLSMEATTAYEEARKAIARFLNAPTEKEVVFTRGATEAINLVAATFGRKHVGPGGKIVITAMEHHANIVPWQVLCEQVGAKLVIAPITDAGEVDLEAFRDLLTTDTKLVAVPHISNALGTINPVVEMVGAAHEMGIATLVDAAQSAPHDVLDVAKLNCDFLVFSGHKMYAPTGIGVLYGKMDRLLDMPPYQSGGDMIRKVTFEKTTFRDPPERFEAGTPHISGAIGLARAIEYLEEKGRERIVAYEEDLTAYGAKRLKEVPGLRFVGEAKKRIGVFSFLLEGIHPHDVGTWLDEKGICVRVGHHCAEPLMERMGVPGTVRASLAFYNTRQEIDRLAEELVRVQKFFG